MQRIKLAFITTILLLAGSVFIWFSTNRPTILVLHSYENRSPWVQNINTGIRRIFSKHSFYRVNYHYMDITQHPDKAISKRAGINALNVINEMQPDYLIIVDDEAQTQVGKQLVNNKSVKMIFCAVKQDIEDYGYDKANNVTGIKISLPLDILNELLVFNVDEGGYKDYINVLHLADTTLLSVEDDVAIKNHHEWYKVKFAKSAFLDTFEQWKQKILDISDDSLVILISNYHALKRSETDQNFVPGKEVIKWTIENTNIPVIGLYGSLVLEGGSLAIAPSAIESGEVAAKMVENLIEENIHISNIPIQESNQFLVYFRKHPAERKSKLIIPALYEAFARAVGHYFSH